MVSRRTAIATVVGVSSAGILAACTPEVSSLTQTPNAESSETSAPESSGQAVEACKVSDVPVGSGKQFNVNGTPLLITQPRSGEFRAFSAVCTHAGYVIQSVQDNEIVCDNHGARFDADNGSVIKTPATRALGKIKVEVQGDSVLVIL